MAEKSVVEDLGTSILITYADGHSVLIRKDAIAYGRTDDSGTTIYLLDVGKKDGPKWFPIHIDLKELGFVLNNV